MDAFFTYGRYQPPTVGHGHVIGQLTEQAIEAGADHFVFVSNSYDQSRNPLPVEQKVRFMEQLFPEANIVTTAINPYDAVRQLCEKGYKNLKMFVGEDRAKNFEDIKKYKNHPDPSKRYAFESFEVVNAGSRLNEDLVSSASGTKLRNYVKEDNFVAFSQYIPSDDVDLKENIFYALKEGMGLMSEAEIISRLTRKINGVKGPH